MNKKDTHIENFGDLIKMVCFAPTAVLTVVLMGMIWSTRAIGYAITAKRNGIER